MSYFLVFALALKVFALAVNLEAAFLMVIRFLDTI
jgi:hypothetical protein